MGLYKTFIKPMRLGLLLLFYGMALLIGSSPVRSSKEIKPDIKKAMLNLPLYFEENRGQADSRVIFISRGNGYGMFLIQNEAVLVLKQHGSSRDDAKLKTSVIRMKFTGSNPKSEMTGIDERPGKSNYFVGNDPSKWRSNVAQYSKVKWDGIYPGIDLVFYGSQQLLEFDYVVAPGVDPKTIKLYIDGADALEVDDEGNLVLRVRADSVLLKKPVCYQMRNGFDEPVECHFVQHDGKQVGFDVGGYDPEIPLVIDPILEYSTYIGGSLEDGVDPIAFDSSGNVYVAGYTASVDFPLANPMQSSLLGDTDIFITKINSSGTSMIYSTYLGGSGIDAVYYYESGTGIAVDSEENIYICGSTYSDDFPTLNPLQATRMGGYDAFVTKIDPTGSGLIYSTYLGGSNDDQCIDIALDSMGNACVAGLTASTDFPTFNPIQPTIADVNSIDGFVLKINSAGDGLIYSTYLGGTGSDVIHDIAQDSSGNVYVTGGTDSLDFPTVNPLQANFAGYSDAFAAKIEPSGNSLVYSTYLGGTGYDFSYGIAIDSFGNAYVAGRTGSHDYPTHNAMQATFGGGYFDALVTKISPAGDELVFSTYYGGSGDEANCDVAIDGTCNVYITGSTSSNDLQLVDPYQAVMNGETDSFVAKISQTGLDIMFSTYLGGGGEDEPFTDNAWTIAVDPLGDVYVVGGTISDNFPVVNALQPLYAGGRDGFIAKFSGFDVTPTPTGTSSPVLTDTPTLSPTETATWITTFTPTTTETATDSPAPSHTGTSFSAPTWTSTATPTYTATVTSTSTDTWTSSPTATMSSTATSSPSDTPTVPASPTPTMTRTPTNTPIHTPSATFTSSLTSTASPTSTIPRCETLFISGNLFNVSEEKVMMVRVLLCDSGKASIAIYNSAGEMVRLLKPWEFTYDTYIEAWWDGKNMSGEPVASGVYIVRFEGSRGADTRKLILIR